MIRTTSSTVLCSARSSLRIFRSATRSRGITTKPPHLVSRSWKNSALRWGLAIGGLYYYNTSPIFAEAPESNLLNPNVDAFDNERDPSIIGTLTASSRDKARKDPSVLQTTLEAASADDAAPDRTRPLPSTTDSQASQTTAISGSATETPDGAPPGALAEEAEGEGAFNPVTGEINWDCPCLGGMAHGPCGPEFREAFSCFVYSTEEPKGMDCVEKFQGMQNCFREHPEVYKDDIADDEELDGELAEEKDKLDKEVEKRRAAVEKKQQQQSEEPKPEESGSASQSKTKSTSKSDPRPVHATSAPNHDAGDGLSDELVPKATHDARDANAAATSKKTEN